jgi:AcrR family transcriptional regulator
MVSIGTAPRRTKAERRNEAERALLDAALRLFARKGLESSSLAEIGAQAGFSRGLSNHHFGSRAALVERLAAETQQAFVDRVSERPEADVEAALAIADAYLDVVSRGSYATRAFFVMWGASFAEEAALREIFVAGDARFRGAIETLVRVGQDRQTIRADVDPVGFAVAFVAILRGVGAQFLVDPDGVDLVAARRACAQFVQSGLAASALDGEAIE